MVLKKENQIYRRQFTVKKVQSSLKLNDRLFLSLIYKISKRAINNLTLVKPSTLLDWQCRFVKNYWTCKHKTPGRKHVSKEVKKLILEMKQDNHLWGCHPIADELKKIGIELHPTTVNKIIQTFRKQGKIQPTCTWKKFLKSHWSSLFGMDFMTIVRFVSSKLAAWLSWDEETGRMYSGQDNLRFDAGRNSLSWR